MELPKRKQNRLTDYDYSAPNAYFVTVCTQDRAPILSEFVGDGFPVPQYGSPVPPNRTPNGENGPLVLKPCGKLAVALIQKIPDKYPTVSVDKYVIMPDHIHMLLRIDIGSGTGDPSPTVGTVIGWYKYQLTKQVNMLRGTEGKRILQRSYYDHIIRNDADYQDVWEYIDGNPAKHYPM